jgi:hypothetical protein
MTVVVMLLLWRVPRHGPQRRGRQDRGGAVVCRHRGRVIATVGCVGWAVPGVLVLGLGLVVVGGLGEGDGGVWLVLVEGLLLVWLELGGAGGGGEGAGVWVVVVVCVVGVVGVGVGAVVVGGIAAADAVVGMVMAGVGSERAPCCCSDAGADCGGGGDGVHVCRGRGGGCRGVSGHLRGTRALCKRSGGWLAAAECRL